MSTNPTPFQQWQRSGRSIPTYDSNVQPSQTSQSRQQKYPQRIPPALPTGGSIPFVSATSHGTEEDTRGSISGAYNEGHNLNTSEPLLHQQQPRRTHHVDAAATARKYNDHVPVVEGRTQRSNSTNGSVEFAPTSNKSTSNPNFNTNFSYRTSSGTGSSAEVSSSGAPVAYTTYSNRVANAARSAGESYNHYEPSTSVVEAPIVLQGSKRYDMQTFFKEVLFMWMGVEETEVLYFDNEGDKEYHLRGGTAAQQSMFAALQSIGSTVKRIDELLRTKSHSFLQQGLKAAIRKEVTAFFYFVASLREQNQITFPSLEIAAMKVKNKLKMLLNLLIETENAKGGELAAILEVYHRQGSQRLKDMMSSIYIETMNPLLQMTIHWLTKGESPDPFVEFFININDRIRDSDDEFWASKYSLRPEMVPVNISSSVAEKIMLVAKNITFIRRCCRAKDWRMDPVIASAAQEATFKTLPRVVEEALKCTNDAVMVLLIKKLEIEDILKTIEAFFLVGCSEFFDLLIHNLDGLLSQMSPHVSLSSVKGAFKGTIDAVSPSLKGHNINMFQNLVSCELEKDEAATGWDAFILTMNIPPPLNNVFDAHVMRQYRRLFRFMLPVKRVEVALKQVWRQSVILDRHIVNTKGARAFERLVSGAHSLGNELTHFVNNLWSYLVYEVGMMALGKLKSSLHKCTSFDEVRKVHADYLHELRLYTLSGENHSSTRRNIESILYIAREFCSIQQELTRIIYNEDVSAIAKLQANYQRIGDAYHRGISSLLSTLEDQHLQFDFMNFLLLRLNFNLFYHESGSRATKTEF